MDRRNFFKILSTVSAGAATTACGHKTDALIPLLVAEHQIEPGEEQFHPGVCTACGAGCGTLVRVMRGERTILRGGEKLREPIACIKKIEGNPLDPISGGRLCARGQAEVQSLYHPDRLRGPMRRAGNRGAAQFTAVAWDQAIGSLAEKLAKADRSRIVLLTSAPAGSRALAIQLFLGSIGAPAAIPCTRGNLENLGLERQAAELAFGWKGVPVYDLAQARYVVGIGADFLGAWASPVLYSRQYGHFRQGRPDLRGRLIQAESRMSLTAQNADEWIPLQPGGELAFTLALARLLLEGKLATNSSAVPDAAMETMRAADLKASGVDEKRLRRIARELGESPAPLVVAGASLPHTNSLNALLAAHYVNLMLGNVGQAGGVLAPGDESTVPSGTLDALSSAQVILLDDANPVYLQPRFVPALEKAEFVASFGSFVDDSAAYADVLLPVHHPLESAMAVVPAVSARAAVTVAVPFVKPLYDTRSLEEILAAIANKMNVVFEAPSPKSFVEPRLAGDQTWEQVARQGGLWSTEAAVTKLSKPTAAIDAADATFTGDGAQYPFHFQPYLSLQYGDGSGAFLPWMQELPDPVSSAIWSIPLEIDPQTAARLGLENGVAVRVESPYGSLEASAYIHPAAVPGVICMAIGQGHTHYGRYASGIGANPLAILAPGFGATRVRLIKATNATSRLIQFSTQDREEGPFGHR
jgi:menaquinone reductase, molybdopterin-binding-like subunit